MVTHNSNIDQSSRSEHDNLLSLWLTNLLFAKYLTALQPAVLCKKPALKFRQVLFPTQDSWQEVCRVMPVSVLSNTAASGWSSAHNEASIVLPTPHSREAVYWLTLRAIRGWMLVDVAGNTFLTGNTVFHTQHSCDRFEEFSCLLNTVVTVTTNCHYRLWDERTCMHRGQQSQPDSWAFSKYVHFLTGHEIYKGMWNPRTHTHITLSLPACSGFICVTTRMLTQNAAAAFCRSLGFTLEHYSAVFLHILKNNTKGVFDAFHGVKCLHIHIIKQPL